MSVVDEAVAVAALLEYLRRRRDGSASVDEVVVDVTGSEHHPVRLLLVAARSDLDAAEAEAGGLAFRVEINRAIDEFEGRLAALTKGAFA